jgi:hypothetical protein
VGTYTYTNLDVRFRARLENFTNRGGYNLLSNIARVRAAISLAVKDLGFYFENTERGQSVRDKVNRWFDPPTVIQGIIAPPAIVPVPDLTKAQLKTISTVFRIIRDGIDTNVTQWIDDQKYGGYGYVRRNPEGTGRAIYIGRKYWARGDQDRFGTVIHELAHLYGNKWDKGYFSNPTDVESETWPVTYWLPKAEGKGTRYVFLSPNQLIDNADSYAGLLTQYYYIPGRVRITEP